MRLPSGGWGSLNWPLTHWDYDVPTHAPVSRELQESRFNGIQNNSEEQGSKGKSRRNKRLGFLFCSFWFCFFLFHFPFFFKLIFIGVQLLYNVVLVSTVQQSESAIRIHISPLFSDFLPIQVTTEHSVEFPELYSRFSLVTYFIHSINNVYMSIPISQFIPPPPSFTPLVSIHLFSTSVFLFLFCKQDHLYRFSRFHIYALIYNICLFHFLH